MVNGIRIPVQHDTCPSDVAFRLETIVSLANASVECREWLLDHHALPENPAGWLPVYLAMADHVPRSSFWPTAINVTSQLLTDKATGPLIRVLCRRMQDERKKLVLEWTEDTGGNHHTHQKAADLLLRLRETFGIQISIDDAGSPGLDAIWRIMHTNPDWVKIDGALFHRALSGNAWSESARICIIHLLKTAKRHRAKTVIEWIETQEQLDKALAYGAEYGQGYFFDYLSKEELP